jgi:hypothetical protein
MVDVRLYFGKEFPEFIMAYIVHLTPDIKWLNNKT